MKPSEEGDSEIEHEAAFMIIVVPTMIVMKMMVVIIVSIVDVLLLPMSINHCYCI